MAFSIYLKLSNITGVDTSDFELYSDVDDYTTPFQTGLSRASLVAGYTSSLVPDNTIQIKIKSNGVCPTEKNEYISNIPTGPVYVCDSTFVIPVNQEGTTYSNTTVNLIDTVGNFTVTISSDGFNQTNEIFVGDSEIQFGEVFTFSPGSGSQTKTVGLFTSQRSNTLSFAISSFGTSSSPFVPFTITCTVSCPTIIDCPSTSDIIIPSVDYTSVFSPINKAVWFRVTDIYGNFDLSLSVVPDQTNGNSVLIQNQLPNVPRQYSVSLPPSSSTSLYTTDTTILHNPTIKSRNYVALNVTTI